MKKANFQAQGIGKILTREQMKKVLGGSDPGDGCKDECGRTGDPACPSGTTCQNTGCGGGPLVKMCR